MERWFPKMWALHDNYRIVVVGFCFLVGVIINWICLWEVVICMIDWINMNIPYFCLADSYWWACRWSSGPCGGSKWGLALDVRWADCCSEPGDTGFTFEILCLVWRFVRGWMLKCSWEVSLEMFIKDSYLWYVDICVLHETCRGVMLNFVFWLTEFILTWFSVWLMKVLFVWLPGFRYRDRAEALGVLDTRFRGSFRQSSE